MGDLYWVSENVENQFLYSQMYSIALCLRFVYLLFSCFSSVSWECLIRFLVIAEMCFVHNFSKRI